MKNVMKKLKLSVILIIVTFSFIGCSQRQDIELIRVKESCATPDVFCDFKSETTDGILVKLLECISELKKANEVCK